MSHIMIMSSVSLNISFDLWLNLLSSAKYYTTAKHATIQEQAKGFPITPPFVCRKQVSSNWITFNFGNNLVAKSNHLLGQLG